MRIAVKGIGLVGGFGAGIDAFERTLAVGGDFATHLSVPTEGGQVELPAFRADTERLEEFVPKRTLRRIDHFTKMGLLGAHLALADAGMLESDHRRMGLVVASGYGATATTFAFLDSVINDGDICASPTHFANSVHNAAAANISILLGATGPSLTVSQFDLSVHSALLAARQMLVERRVDAVLFGAIDELSDLIGYTWYRQRGLGDTSASSPLTTREGSAILGEGAAFFLLTREEAAGEGYCAIEAISTGSAPPPLPGGLLLLGADGRADFGERYRRGIAAGSAVACYTTYYGTFPTGPAFDLAAAALMLKKSTVFPPPQADTDIPGVRVQPAGDLPGNRVSCLSLVGEGEHGLVTLGRF